MTNVNNVEPSGNGGEIFGLGRDGLCILVFTLLAIGSAYEAGQRVSDKVQRATNKEKRKGEKALRRERKEREKEKAYQRRLQRIRARRGR